MLKYELATSLTLNIEKYCYFYLNGLADLWCLRGGTRRREFRYIYKPGKPSRTRGRAYLFHVFLTTTRNFNEIQRSILLIMIICEILLFICFVLILGIKINEDWDRSFKHKFKNRPLNEAS